MKKSILILTFLMSLLAQSQTDVKIWNVSVEKNTNIIPIKNQLTNEMLLNFKGKERLTFVKVSDQMEILDSVSFNKGDNSYFVEYAIDTNNNPTLFYRSNKTDFVGEFYDLKAKTVTPKYNFSISKEESVFESFTYQNNFYLLTIEKKSSVLKIYKFSTSESYPPITVDLSSCRFVDSEYKKSTLYDLISSKGLQLLEPDRMVSLLKASRKIKMYINENTIDLTLDHNRNFTQLISINLTDGTFTEKIVNKPMITDLDNPFIKSNSFYLEGKLYQYKAGDKSLSFQIGKPGEEEPKIYTIEDEMPITWKNTEIIELYDNKKDNLEKSNQFLNKLQNMNNDGVSVYKLDDKYLVTLGVVSEERQSTGAAIAGQFGVIGVLMYVALTPNFTNYTDYLNRKVVYFHSILDENGNFTKTELKPLAFDEIIKYVNTLEKHQMFSMFKNKGVYWVGSYDKKEKKYYWKKFQD